MESFKTGELSRSVPANVEGIRRKVAAACQRSGRDISSVKIIAVTKNFPPEAVRLAFQSGLRDFGENRVQEAQVKYGQLNDIRAQLTLHFVGHLQTNKVRDVLRTADVVQSVDSVRLAEMLSRQASKKLPVMLEVNVAGEDSKYGFTPESLDSEVSGVIKLPNLEVWGLMTIPPLVDDPEKVRPVFRKLKELNVRYGFKELSMGMTDDFEVAVEEGATMIRIGRAIFGERS